MEGMSERQYAAHVGLSRGAIQKAKEAGRLVQYADGSIDAVASDARRAAMTDPAKQRGASTTAPAAKLKSELIDRDRAVSLVVRLAREERDAWVTWPARAAALMASELGVMIADHGVLEPAMMQKVLEAHVRAQLDSLAEVRIDLR